MTILWTLLWTCHANPQVLHQGLPNDRTSDLKEMGYNLKRDGGSTILPRKITRWCRKMGCLENMLVKNTMKFSPSFFHPHGQGWPYHELACGVGLFMISLFFSVSISLIPFAFSIHFHIHHFACQCPRRFCHCLPFHLKGVTLGSPYVHGVAATPYVEVRNIFTKVPLFGLIQVI